MSEPQAKDAAAPQHEYQKLEHKAEAYLGNATRQTATGAKVFPVKRRSRLYHAPREEGDPSKLLIE